LNITDQSHPPDWRITYYTQIFANYSARWQAQIFKIRRNLNTTADTLARQAFSASVPTSSTHELRALIVIMVISARWWMHWPM
jgi:hypothetical protein